MVVFAIYAGIRLFRDIQTMIAQTSATVSSASSHHQFKQPLMRLCLFLLTALHLTQTWALATPHHPPHRHWQPGQQSDQRYQSALPAIDW